MIKVKTDYLGREIDYVQYADEIEKINQGIDAKSLPGSDFLGWANYPEEYDKEEFARILKAAEFIRNNVDILVVAGIGGSYLGARAAIEAINGLYGDDKMEIIFFGNTMNGKMSKQILHKLEGKKFAINVISKSGTTTETAVAFR
ncbi:MAG: glucose-6-phosphate isomerase, partial [Bacilli bacterium]|nr:glucose-6-phosphate isomerase [Bacilli bacterium]